MRRSVRRCGGEEEDVEEFGKCCLVTSSTEKANIKPEFLFLYFNFSILFVCLSVFLSACLSKNNNSSKIRLKYAIVRNGTKLFAQNIQTPIKEYK